MISIGLVGCGDWGKNIFRDLLLLGTAVYVADIAESACEYAQAHGAAGVVSQAASLPRCDGYVVAVSVPDLCPVCCTLLARKKPIFVEKTLCRTMEDVAKLENLGGGEYLFAMHKWRYHPGIESLRTIAASDRLGPLQQIVTHRTRWESSRFGYHGGDALFTFLVHDLTIVKHILGQVPQQVLAANVLECDDGFPLGCVALLQDKAHGVTISLNLQTRHCRKNSGVSIHGVKGTAELFDAYDDHVTIQTADGEEKVDLDKTFPLYTELKEFVNYLAGGPKPCCDFVEAKEITQALLRILRSAKQSTSKMDHVAVEGTP